MSATKRSRPEIDEALLLQVAALPRPVQSWLKTALQAIATIGPFSEHKEEEALSRPRRKASHPRGGAPLNEVLSGEADLQEQAEAYPELDEELRGIADIADLLREAGRQHRRLGEDILGESEDENKDREDGATS